ncbi:MAG TPA: hypothetical protein VKZ42_05845 [Flavobacteriaceae bacterium]|jgi:hypothetical protein|nr:hypothetical protein [Flavobacteriaceae bacterium]
MKPTFFILAVTFLFISSCSVESIEEVDVELKSKAVFVEGNTTNNSGTLTDEAGTQYEVRNPVVITRTNRP